MKVNMGFVTEVIVQIARNRARHSGVAFEAFLVDAASAVDEFIVSGIARFVVTRNGFVHLA